MTSTLHAYLNQQFPPPNISQNRPQRASTSSDNFSTEDITAVHPWDFSAEMLRQWFHQELYNERIIPDLVSNTVSPQRGYPLKEIGNEKGIVAYYNRAHYVALNRALRESQVADTERDAFPADRLAVTSTGDATLVGEIKPSWIYHSSFRRTDRHQVLSQLLFYMHSFELQYGYILTDLELIAVKRDSREEYGSVFCSEPVAWDGILLALWGLHQLALRNPQMPRLEKPERPEYDRAGMDPDYV